ncbi:YggS family pyridoxal phosphate enzyme [Phialophora macrospora]|uniref:Pyridoxal phosphate homeostasis protein n=1 Tax=Phialophora macrospora TaxID=1851006 RepID=A0A0D2GHL6_9EURO|nr:YggS family pyridoxal phosphate enzyme [Phialophora macrospora]
MTGPTESQPSTSTTNSTAMKAPIPIQLNPQRVAVLAHNLSSIQSRIASTLSSLPSPQSARHVRLVAVSKLKPASDILSLHSPPPPPPPSADEVPVAGHRHFGENYVQELLEKSRLLPRTIKWHFIGGLQSNKCAQLAREVEALWAVESVDSEKKASLLDKGRGERNQRLRKEFGAEWTAEFEGNEWEEKLRVFIQVNTSGEESKSGLEPESSELVSLAKFIRSDESCPNLHLQGLMTIGAIARSKATTPETENEDFITLRATRDKIVAELGLTDKEELELSMGMSEDFESAVRLGSNEVRVGSTIFGERPAKKDAKVIEDAETEKK